MKRFLLLLLIIAGCSVTATAKYAPLEMFILHEKDEATFVPVSTLWSIDKNYNATAANAYVDNAQFLNIDKAQLSTFIKANNKGISLILPKKDGGIYTIDLAQYNMLAAGFKVQTMAGNVATDHAYTPGLYYRGVVNGVPGSLACFSFFNDEVYGLFSIPGEGNYTIAPNHITDRNNKTQYILFNDMDSKIKPKGGCAQELLENKGNVTTSGTLGRNAYNTCREIKVFEKGDYSVYLSAASSVASATNYVTACFNASSTIYRNEGIYTSMKLFQLDTVSDAYQDPSYTSSVDFLTEFGTETQDSLHGADVAMLLSTINGTYGGVAWVGTLCTQYDPAYHSGPYAFVNIQGDYAALPAYSFDVVGITHEMGHTLGSPHTHNCSWPGGAIDGCYTLEGNCAMPVPQYPVNGGTIMSYCHLVAGVGINISNGFGPLPGNLVRNTVATTSCGNIYSVGKALATTNTQLNANRECTMSGTSYYWNDNNTADTTDDKLVLQIIKNGNDIGTIDSPGFLAQTVTTAGYGTGSASLINFPAGTSGSVLDTSYAMHRYWKLNTGILPASSIEIMFPFLQTDKNDLFNTLISYAAADTNIYMYLVRSANPNPTLGFAGATAGNFNIYSKSTTPSSTGWTETVVGNIHFAHLLTSSSSVGGSGFVTYRKYLDAENIYTPSDVLVFSPNPAKNEWTVTIPNSLDGAPLQVFDAQGRMVITQLLYSSANNRISTSNLPAGIYFYRAAGKAVYTGRLVKE